MNFRFSTQIIFILVLLGLSACAPATTPTTSSDPTEEPFYAPDFTLTALDSTTYTLSELRGKWVLVNFWATWCEPCKQELPMFQQVAETHPDTLTVLAINQREDESLVAPFVEGYGLTFPILMYPDDATVLAYQVMGLPQTLIVDPAGEVVFRKFGEVSAEDLAIVDS